MNTKIQSVSPTSPNTTSKHKERKEKETLTALGLARQIRLDIVHQILAIAQFVRVLQPPDLMPGTAQYELDEEHLVRPEPDERLPREVDVGAKRAQCE
jgi:hypothetical protein